MTDQFLLVEQFNFEVHEAIEIHPLLASMVVITTQKVMAPAMQFFQAVFEYLALWQQT